MATPDPANDNVEPTQPKTFRQRFDEIRSHRYYTATSVIYSIFVDQFLWAAPLPLYAWSLKKQMGVPEDEVTKWITIQLSVFGAATLVTSAPWGWVVDRYPSLRKWGFNFGLLVLLATTLILWLSKSLAAQVVARILQGFASSIVYTSGVSTMHLAVGPKRTGKYDGFVAIALCMGTLVAPLMGGAVYQRAGYNAVWGMILAVVGLDILLRLGMLGIHTKANENPEQSDDEENAAGAMPQRGNEDRSASSRTPSSESSCERKPTAPPIPDQEGLTEEITQKVSKWPAALRLLRDPRMLAAMWATLVMAINWSAMQTVIPLFVKEAFNWNSTGAGAVFVALCSPSIFGPLIGKLIDKAGGRGRWISTFGFVLLTASVALRRLVKDNTLEHKALLCFFLALFGCGQVCFMEPNSVEYTRAAERLDAADAAKRRNSSNAQGSEATTSEARSSALWNMAWAGGNTLGPVWAGLLWEMGPDADHLQNWRIISMNMALLAGLTMVPISVYQWASVDLVANCAMGFQEGGRL